MSTIFNVFCTEQITKNVSVLTMSLIFDRSKIYIKLEIKICCPVGGCMNLNSCLSGDFLVPP